MIPFFAPIEPNSQNFCRKFAEFFVVQYKYKVLSDVFFQKSVQCLIFLFLFFSVSRCWHTAVSKNRINQILSSRNYERLFHGNLGKWKTKTIQV